MSIDNTHSFGPPWTPSRRPRRSAPAQEQVDGGAETHVAIGPLAHPLVREIADRYGISDSDLEGLADALARRDCGPAGPIPQLDLDRYEDCGEIARGGMGALHVLRDRILERTLAMKVLRPRFSSDPVAIERFRDEARIAANLVHPGIVPVIDIRRTPEGRIGILMELIDGQRFDEAIRAVHPRGRRRPALDRLRGLIDATIQLAGVVGFAHARRVLHRDIKAANALVRWEPDGEPRVWIIDWGLSGIRQSAGAPAAGDLTDSRYTLKGTVCGTPRTMSPEAARGDVGIDARADVYSLGVVLYEAMTGRNPWKHIPNADLVEHLQAGPAAPRPVEHLAPGLADICQRAMHPSPDARYADAGELVGALVRWSQRADAWARAADHTADADAMLQAEQDLEARIRVLSAEADRTERQIPTWAGVVQKRPLWQLQDRLVALTADLEQLQEDRHAALLAAIAAVPDFPDAVEQLATRARSLHEEAEEQGQTRAARRHETVLGAYNRGAHTRYLDGRGAVSLALSRPAGVRIRAWRTLDRQLVPGEVVWSGRAPLADVAVPHGRYLVEILPDNGTSTVRLPIELRRNEHWRAIPPGHTAARQLWIPDRGDVLPGEVYIPAGFTWFGDPGAPGGVPCRRVWVEGTFFQRDPVLLTDYLSSLDDLAARGREDEAFRLAPRNRNTGDGPEGMEIGWDPATRRFFLKTDEDGDAWHPRWPVMMCGYRGAEAYAAWLNERFNLNYRLPYEVEWERAARGGDTRIYPWGDAIDPSFALTHASTPEGEAPCLQPIEAFASDVSPFGIRRLAGHVMDWCASPGRPEGPEVDALGRWHDAEALGETRVIRGGAWGRELARARIGSRSFAGTSRSPLVGFRLLRPAPIR